MALTLSHRKTSLSGIQIPTGAFHNRSAENSPTASTLSVSKSLVAMQAAKLINNVQRIRRPLVVEEIRPDLSAASRAFATAEMKEKEEERVAQYREGEQKNDEKGVPVYVMMPLDSVRMEGDGMNRKKAMKASLQALKCAGVEGVMVDVWWGLVERESPGVYKWGGYAELLDLAKNIGLKVQAVMSFHQCGGNVGDSCTKSKLGWVQLVSFVTLRTQNRMEHGDSQELGPSNAMTSLKATAEAVGKSEWGHAGPTDAGHYNNWPEDTSFFRKEGGGWNSEYGEFFLNWYSQMLLDHGERILSCAKPIFEGQGVKISVKIAGIHWHYGTRSHAPELTAGYYNTRFRDGYLPIAHMLARHGAVFNFTCIEMRDHEQPQDALCAPEKLVQQVALATQQAQVSLAGENALPRYDEHAYEQILKASSLNTDTKSKNREMCAFTYLRMNQDLFQADNWSKFVTFVKKM
ncbi:hypothetical protein Ancab_030800 [Ancistrocladus abbreviatus]